MMAFCELEDTSRRLIIRPKFELSLGSDKNKFVHGEGENHADVEEGVGGATRLFHRFSFGLSPLEHSPIQIRNR